MDLTNRGNPPTETTTETTAQTTAAGRPAPAGETGDDAAAAVAALVEELVSHGVSRAAAGRYARGKPDVCRRCLEYQPYARYRTTKGAWLANAIRDEYGPPAGYAEARVRVERERQAQRREAERKARQGRAAALRREQQARLREAYWDMESAGGEALSAFTEFVQRERAKAWRVVARLSPGRQGQLASFDEPQRRLELFAAWLESLGKPAADGGPCPAASGAAGE